MAPVSDVSILIATSIASPGSMSPAWKTVSAAAANGGPSASAVSYWTRDTTFRPSTQPILASGIVTSPTLLIRIASLISGCSGVVYAVCRIRPIVASGSP